MLSPMQTTKTSLNAYLRLMRLDKPIGILLLLWPTLWGVLIASQGHVEWNILLIFILGTVLMRSAGCVMNDIADKDFDGHVARTNQRPLATGEINVKHAYLLTVVLTLIAFALVCLLNIKTILLSFLALFLAASYPLTKRWLAIPQAYLGIAFGVGIPMAFAAVQNTVPLVAWVLFAANVFWAIAYDTAYAMVDRDDDLKIGIHSSAITFGRYDVYAIMICYAITLMLLVMAGYLAQLGWLYYLGLFVAGLISLYHYRLISTRERLQCFKAFLHNNWFGFVICFGILCHYAWAPFVNLS